MNNSQSSDIYISMVLAHSLVYESNQEWLPVKDARNGGDPPAPTVQNSTGDVIASLVQYLPTLTEQTAQAIPAIEQARTVAAQQSSPQLAALNQLLYQTYGPQLAQTSSDITRQNLLSAAANENELARTQGPEAAQSYTDLAKLIDPEYYASRSSAGNALTSLLQPSLTGGEREEIQRSLNRQNESRGTSSAPSRLSTVENAATFGGALRDRLGQALNLTVGVLPTFRTGYNPVTSGLGKTAAANAAESHFTGVNQPSDTGANMTNSFLQGITGLKGQQNDINANRRDSLDRVTGVLGSLPDIS